MRQARCLLEILPFFFDRAQKRILQQRNESKLDLRRIVDIRKKVFHQVKVRFFASLTRSYPKARM